MKRFSNKLLTRNSFKSIVATALLILSRLIKLAPNFSPLGSYGFFSGNIFSFFVSIFVFDYFIGGTYKGSLFTYLGFVSYLILGKVARSDKQRLILLPLSSFIFFLISNFGVWWFWYDHSVQNLVTCYLLAVPFYRNTLIGDMLFGYGYMAFRKMVQKGTTLQTIGDRLKNFTFSYLSN